MPMRAGACEPPSRRTFRVAIGKRADRETREGRMSRLISRAGGAALALGLSTAIAAAQNAAPAAAGEAATRPRLTAEQREEARQRFLAMTPEERQKFVDQRRAERAEALARMTPEQREQAEARRKAARERWAKMTPAERDELRKRTAERRRERGSTQPN